MDGVMECMKCGQLLPLAKLERMKTGTYRRVCNHCKWIYYVRPSRYRRIIRELSCHKAPGTSSQDVRQASQGA